MGTYQIQPEDAPRDERVEFERQQAAILARRVEMTAPIFSYILLGCLLGVFLCQLFAGEDRSVFAAGLVKPLVWQGEFWRLLTSATLHGGFLHIYFNGQALYNIGSMIEALSNRAHVAICFLLSAIGGSLTSLYLMPETTSIGASGGVIGLFGFLGVYGYKNKQHLPPGFLRNIVINLLLIAAIGVIGYSFIDNAAHAGGLVVGTIYGLLTTRRNELSEPKAASGFVNIFGYISLLLVAASALFSIIRILSFQQVR
ncbi:MAG: rhomboid family intramembrane serine protease [Acidobacteriota bacterium]|nr:rhomboid family intramembrane serine protease [Acidobacteriota bacterium]